MGQWSGNKTRQAGVAHCGKSPTLTDSLLWGRWQVKVKGRALVRFASQTRVLCGFDSYCSTNLGVCMKLVYKSHLKCEGAEASCRFESYYAHQLLWRV